MSLLRRSVSGKLSSRSLDRLGQVLSLEHSVGELDNSDKSSLFNDFFDCKWGSSVVLYLARNMKRSKFIDGHVIIGVMPQADLKDYC